ncbi:MAG: alpha-hydroxy-acid oxidizing protein [Haloarculaceae archaeon]
MIVPRLLRDVSERDLSVELFGRTYDVPLHLSPVGVQHICHEEGELAAARGADAAGGPFVLSSVSSYTMEEVTGELGETPGWFQLYPSTEDALVESLVDRAERAGYEAIVLTVDTPVPGWRERDLSRGHLPQLADGEGLANYTSDPAFAELLDGDPDADDFATVETFFDAFGDASLSWDDFEWLTGFTDLPVLVKGLLHPDDATEALARGADGVVVSNHGGRQVDGSIAAIEALPRVREAVGPDATVLLDSGVRRGAEALKALALGADSVGVGRPYVYGLAVDGANGVEGACRNLVADLDRSILVDEREL